MKLGHLMLGGAAGLGLWMLLSRPRPKPPFLVMGDSIAEGVGAALERLAPGQAATAALSGESVGASARLASNRLLLHPETRTVVLSTGVNSLDDRPAAEVMNATLEIVEQLRALGRAVVLIGPPPAFAYSDDTTWRSNLSALERLHGRMAGRVSLWVLLGDREHSGYFDERYGTPGGLHPNAAGYERVARAIRGR